MAKKQSGKRAKPANREGTIRDVPPGKYRAFAWEAIDPVSNVYIDPDFIAPLENRSTAVSLGESDHAIIKVSSISDR